MSPGGLFGVREQRGRAAGMEECDRLVLADLASPDVIDHPSRGSRGVHRVEDDSLGPSEQAWRLVQGRGRDAIRSRRMFSICMSYCVLLVYGERTVSGTRA